MNPIEYREFFWTGYLAILGVGLLLIAYAL